MTRVARATRTASTKELQQRLHELRREVADLEAQAEGHLDHGRTVEATELLSRAGRLRRDSYGIEFDLATRPNFPKRTRSWWVER